MESRSVVIIEKTLSIVFTIVYFIYLPFKFISRFILKVIKDVSHAVYGRMVEYLSKLIFGGILTYLLYFVTRIS